MSKRIVIIVGTRPNFIKITQFEKEFAKYKGEFDYKLVHTGQHYDKNMSALFFEQLQLKKPDVTLNIKGKSPSDQIGTIIIQLSELFLEWQPDLAIVVGDVNSTLAASIAAKKSGIRIAHLESGLRSFDQEMPEEINRLLTDTITDDFFITEQSGLDNLSKELPHKAGLHFVGNTMIDTLIAFDKAIQADTILEELKVTKNSYALMTMHRPRNVDTKKSLLKIIELINKITKNSQLVFPIHPRTKKSLEKHGLFSQVENNAAVILTKPLGYLAFQKLIAASKYVITDSGGIQEETTYRRVPCLTLRPNTERPSTITLGSNELVPFDPIIIGEKIQSIHEGTYKKGQIPPLWDGQATKRIVAAIAEILEIKQATNSVLSI